MKYTGVVSVVIGIIFIWGGIFLMSDALHRMNTEVVTDDQTVTVVKLDGSLDTLTIEKPGKDRWLLCAEVHPSDGSYILQCVVEKDGKAGSVFIPYHPDES